MSSTIDRIAALIANHDCSNCGATEERVFTDSYTGAELCLMCLAPIISEINASPATEGPDNLQQLLDGEN